MRVLHLISSGGMYGAEAVILQLSAELQAGGQDESVVGIFAHASQPEPAFYKAAVAAGVSATLLPCNGQIDVGAGKAIQALVQRTGAVVVHAHGYKADIYTFAALRGRHRPALVSTCHTWYDNDWAVRLYGAADRWVLRHLDAVVAVSAEVRERLLRAGVAAENVQLVRNGVDVKAGMESSRPERGALRVGLVGRLAPEKGVDVYLRGAAMVAKVLPEVEFAVAGEGSERGALEVLLAELNLDGRAVLMGAQTGMGEFYGSLDLLVSASRQEGLPMALLEGMASGLPVVATRVGEVPTVVEDGVTGLLVEPDAPEELAAAMRRLLEDRALRERFGVAGRERVQREFSAERMAMAYRAVYEEALGRRSAQRAGAGS